MVHPLCRLVFKKLVRLSVDETATEGPSSKRLHVRDTKTGRVFLVDSGAEVSVLPAHPSIRKNPSNCRLYAANDTPIDTYGETFCTLDLGLRRPISLNFIIAAVPNAILGADILNRYGLLIDLRNRRLVDSLTSLHTIGVVKQAQSLPIHSVASDSRCAQLLAEFPDITGSAAPNPLFKPD